MAHVLMKASFHTGRTTMIARKFTATALFALLCSTAAHADIITVTPAAIGTSYTVNYDGFSDGNVIDGLTGTAILTLKEADGTRYTFDYELTNTSSDPIDASRISIFGFNTDPTIASASSSGLFDTVALNANVPSGFGTVDVCFKGAGGENSCAGGGGTGLAAGESGSGSLTLNFSSLVQELTLSDFFVRYQGIEGAGNVTSAIGRGTTTSTGSTGSTGGTPVPAPAALWLFAGGLAVVGLRMGRRRKTLQLAA
jgi:hypothetical protein